MVCWLALDWYLPNYFFVLSEAWAIGKTCGPPCKIPRASFGLGVAVGLTSVLQRHDVLVHSTVRTAQLVVPYCVGIVVWAWTLTGFASEIIDDVATVGAASALVLVDVAGVCLLRILPRHAGLEGSEVSVWLHAAELLLYMAQSCYWQFTLVPSHPSPCLPGLFRPCPCFCCCWYCIGCWNCSGCWSCMDFSICIWPSCCVNAVSAYCWLWMVWAITCCWPWVAVCPRAKFSIDVSNAASLLACCFALPLEPHCWSVGVVYFLRRYFAWQNTLQLCQPWWLECRITNSL